MVKFIRGRGFQTTNNEVESGMRSDTLPSRALKRPITARNAVVRVSNQMRRRRSPVPTISRRSLAAFNRPSTKQLLNFTVVAKMSPSTRKMGVKEIVRKGVGNGPSGVRLTRTIVNERSVGKMNDRIGLRRSENINVRGARLGNSLFLNAMRTAQADTTPYDPDIEMDIVEEQRSPARNRLGPLIQRQPNRSLPDTAARLLLTNLATSVTQNDVQELCSSVDGLIECRLIEPGFAEAIYSSKTAAQQAINVYDKRELDGVPMQLQLCEAPKPKSVIGQQQPNRNRAVGENSPLGSAVRQQAKNKSSEAHSGEDIDRDLITSALFPQSKADSSGVTFTVKI